MLSFVIKYIYIPYCYRQKRRRHNATGKENMEARFMQYFLQPKNPYRVFKVHINPFMKASVLCFQGLKPSV